MTHSGHGKQVIFTKYSMIILDSIDGSKISLGKVDHKNKLYVFSKFLLKTPTLALLMHSNDVSKLWQDMFGHINLR